MLKKLANVNKRFDIYVGSNEEIRYRNGSELLKELKFQEISEEEVKTILKFVGYSYGHVNFIDTAFYLIEEMEDNDK